ncbi:MAG: sugar phosphate isomerase/epimerase [Phycisphaerae bacterium]|nr:sugar phosphate isomerase/epimerase [Phycisphaerae bacterium]
MEATDRLGRRDFLKGATAAGAFLAVGCSETGPLGGRPMPANPPKKAWQIGCYTRPWDQHDYRVALDAIAEAGFKYVGLMTTKAQPPLVISAANRVEEAEAIGREVAKRGLIAPSVYGGDIPVHESLEAGINALRRLIDNCAAARVGNLMMGGIGDQRLYTAYYKAIAECCDYAADKKVGISVKPHGGLNATGPQCRKAIESVGHRNFRLWYDPGNILYYSDGRLDPIDDAATVDGLVVGMSVKDYRHPKNVDVTPGSGQVNFLAVMDRLKKGGFTHGPLIVETLTRGDLPRLLEEARKARAFLETL